MKILVAGYPYIRQNYFNVFKYFPLSKENLFFLLPKLWKVKGGKVIFYPPKERGVIPATAFFHHSNYPIIGGALKGWMPIFPLVVLKLKFKKKLDMVYSCSEPILLTTLYQAFWSKIFGLKHIFFTWENIDYGEKLKGLRGFFHNLIIRLNLALSDGIICGNHKGEQIIKKMTQKPVVVILMSGVDEEFFKPSESKIKKEFGGINLDGKIVFSFTGAIGFRKGIHCAIKAFSLVLRQIPNSVLIIAGSGEYEREIDQLIDNLDLRKNIIRISWLNQEQLRNLFSVSDVFLYPSLPYGGWEEQFGYTMAEASLMELPVISTTSGSIEEVVVSGKTGILILPDDVEQLRDAMLKLAKDSDLRKKMGQAGRQHITKNFSHQKIAQRFYELFRSII